MVAVAPAGTGKSWMCSSRCQGVTIRSHVFLLLPGIGWSPFPLGQQVAEPQQLRGPGLQVDADLCLGLGGGTAQRVEQRAVVIGAAAERAAGTFSQGQGEPLLMLELGMEPGQPRAARGGDEGSVEEPVTVEHAGRVAAGERGLDLADQALQSLEDGRVAVHGEGFGGGCLDGGASGVDVTDIGRGDLGNHDAAVHLMADQALAAEQAGGLTDGVPGDAEFGSQRDFAQRRAWRQLPGQDGVPERGGDLLGGGLSLDGRAEPGQRAGSSRSVIHSVSIMSYCSTIQQNENANGLERAKRAGGQGVDGTWDRYEPDGTSTPNESGKVGQERLTGREVTVMRRAGARSAVRAAGSRKKAAGRRLPEEGCGARPT